MGQDDLVDVVKMLRSRGHFAASYVAAKINAARFDTTAEIQSMAANAARLAGDPPGAMRYAIAGAEASDVYATRSSWSRDKLTAARAWAAAAHPARARAARSCLPMRRGPDRTSGSRPCAR